MRVNGLEHRQRQPGLLVVGHGTRHRLGTDEFLATVAQIESRLRGVAVEPGFLELARPTIAEGVAALAARGAERLVALPLLLFAAGHVQRDIPQAVNAAAEVYGLWVEQADYLGCHPKIVELSALRYREATAEVNDLPAERTVVVMVGRGSQDPQANAEMYRFARLRFEAAPADWLEVCFTALCPPSVAVGLELAARLPFDRVIVQPHFLFEGQLVERVRAEVERRQAAGPYRRWLVVPHLGAHPLLAEAAVARTGLATAATG